MDPEELERLRCNPDMNFIVLLAFAFKKAKADRVISAKEAIAIVVADTMRGNCPGTRGLSPNLLKNFSEGYRNAIKNYGEEVAAERMERYLVRIIADKMRLETSVVDEHMNRSLSIQELFINGIHLTKDSNGEYKSYNIRDKYPKGE